MIFSEHGRQCNLCRCHQRQCHQYQGHGCQHGRHHGSTCTLLGTQWQERRRRGENSLLGHFPPLLSFFFILYFKWDPAFILHSCILHNVVLNLPDSHIIHMFSPSLFSLSLSFFLTPSGCMRCHGNKVSTINGVFFLSSLSLSLSPPGYFSPRRGYRRVPKFCMGF